ncbi:MAG TPA: threonine--tRNA ligase [Candidatus Nanoarchaeia archaeon]|nr:threonine--tRNA ligase [Candidatus Nanoarchaeia archaeon]
MENKNSIETIRHSLSHLLAAAVKELYPDVKLAIGPAIDTGFYYDFDFGDKKIGDAELKEIEKKMEHLRKQNLQFTILNLPIDEAIKKAEAENQPYKKELIEDLKKSPASAEASAGEGQKTVSYYTVGKFTDLCRGPHIENTNQIPKGSWKLNKLAGAYWRGDEKNKMLTRIYGLAFASKEELENYVKMQAEAAKRDHKKLGRELDMYSFHEEAPGFVFWHEKGMIFWNELEKLGKQIRKKHGFIEIKTPQLAKKTLWETSGHWDHYHEDMFVFDVDQETYCLKPMDCPFNIKIYQTRMRSYRELPIRYTEIGRVFRNEKSGQLNGLFRVREISQDDSHLFVSEDQVKPEIANLLEMVGEFYAALGIEPKFFLSTRPEDFMGEIATWDKAEKDLREALAEKNISYGLKEKDGAFYGPKIDVNLTDAFGRSWQVATIQLDFQLPGRFGCEYISSDGAAKTPVLIHAAIFGSFERMTGILMEHYGGNFPAWLSPVQVKILSVGEHHLDFCRGLLAKFQAAEVRAELDDSDETVGNKTRKAVNEKVPYILVVGDQEMQSGKLAVRERGSRDTREMSIDELVKIISDSRPKI